MLSCGLKVMLSTQGFNEESPAILPQIILHWLCSTLTAAYLQVIELFRGFTHFKSRGVPRVNSPVRPGNTVWSWPNFRFFGPCEFRCGKKEGH